MSFVVTSGDNRLGRMSLDFFNSFLRCKEKTSVISQGHCID